MLSSSSFFHEIPNRERIHPAVRPAYRVHQVRVLTGMPVMSAIGLAASNSPNLTFKEIPAMVPQGIFMIRGRPEGRERW
jgi:hypothetical protein